MNFFWYNVDCEIYFSFQKSGLKSLWLELILNGYVFVDFNFLAYFHKLLTRLMWLLWLGFCLLPHLLVGYLSYQPATCVMTWTDELFYFVISLLESLLIIAGVYIPWVCYFFNYVIVVTGMLSNYCPVKMNHVNGI